MLLKWTDKLNKSLEKFLKKILRLLVGKLNEFS
jgi:hypothetical protein